MRAFLLRRYRQCRLLLFTAENSQDQRSVLLLYRR